METCFTAQSYVKLGHYCTPIRRSHISDEDLERYCMGRVQGAGLHALETHLTECPACVERAREHDAYLRAMRGAIKMSLDSPEECDTLMPR